MPIKKIGAAAGKAFQDGYAYHILNNPDTFTASRASIDKFQEIAFEPDVLKL